MAVVAAEIFGVPGLGQRMMQASSLLASDVVVVYMADHGRALRHDRHRFVALQSWLLRWKAIISLDPDRADCFARDGHATEVLRDFSLDVPAGRFVAIIGRPASASPPCCA